MIQAGVWRRRFVAAVFAFGLGASLGNAQSSTRSDPRASPAFDPQNPFGIANPSVPELIEKLRDPDPRVRVAAAMALLSRGDAAVSAIPALTVAARDPSEEVQRWSMYALGRQGARAAEAIPVLIERLKANSSSVRQAAAETLREIGPPPEAADALFEAVGREDYDGSARGAAVAALVRTGVTERVVRRLAQLLADPQVSDAARNALVALGPQAKAALPELIAAIEDPESRARRPAAKVLGHMGATAGPAIPGLFGLLEDRDLGLRETAAAAIRAIRSSRRTSIR